MKAVICANGKGSRWENYLGVTKHMIEIDGEPILHRTVRLLKNYGFKDIVISASNPDYAVEGTVLYTPKRNVWLIDQYPLELLTEPVLLLLGDVYFTETAIRGILTAPENPWTFFDTNCPTKSWTEQVAVKINDFENFAKAERQYRKDCYAGKTNNAGGLELHALLENVPYSGYRNVQRNTVVLPSDETTDFDYPEDYNQWMARFRSA